MASPFPIPLNAIRAIEIVARRGALAPAAEELGVTPGAVSQHLRRAEERLGIELFERTPKGLRPTEALRAVLPQLTQGFNALAGAVASLKGADEHVLTLTVGSVFASRWLIWRIAKFNRLHPEIETRLVVTGTMIDLAHSDDCGIRFGGGEWAGVTAELLGGASYAPVVAPELAPRLRKPSDLADVPIIIDRASMLPWDDWFRAVGIDDPPAPRGPTLDDPALAFDAAISGQGALLTVDLMAADAIGDGRLVRPFPNVVQSELGYWLVVAEGRRVPKKVKLFREWLRTEVPDSVNGYVAQVKRGSNRSG